MVVDWGASGRTDEYRFFLVDPFSLAEAGEVEVEAGESSLTWGYYTDNKLTGSLKMHGSDFRGRDRDWLVRVRQTTTIAGVASTRTLGTMFVDVASTHALFGRVTRSIDCYSTLLRFTKDDLVRDLYRPTGYNVVQAIRDVVETDGGILAIGDGVDTAREFSRDIVFELGTCRATAINTIAGWINCQIGVDPDGRITLERYISPADKQVSYTFEAGRNCVYKPGLDDSLGSSDPINRVVVYYSRDDVKEGDAYPATDRAMVDLPDGYDFSYARCGRRRSKIIKLSDPCSHAELEARAETTLYENCGVTRYLEIEHASVPEVIPGAVVRYLNYIDYGQPLDLICMVADIEMSLIPGGMCKTKLKVIR